MEFNYENTVQCTRHSALMSFLWWKKRAAKVKLTIQNKNEFYNKKKGIAIGRDELFHSQMNENKYEKWKLYK